MMEDAGSAFGSALGLASALLVAWVRERMGPGAEVCANADGTSALLSSPERRGRRYASSRERPGACGFPTRCCLGRST